MDNKFIKFTSCFIPISSWRKKYRNFWNNKLQKKPSKYFINEDIKPIYYKDYNARNDVFADKKNLYIVMQGPIKEENNYTIETVKLYLETFKGCPIIVSTWKSEKEEFLKQLEDLGVTVLRNDPPEIKDFCNTNYQIKSTQAGLKKAKEFGAEYVIKTRTDQRFYETNLTEYLFNIQKLFPKASDKQKSRLVALSFNTFKYWLYDVSDMFLFGHIDDVMDYWSCAYETRNQWPSYSNIKEYCIAKPNEIGVCVKYLEKIGESLDYTLKNSWEMYAKYFCIIDASSLRLHWGKYTNEAFRWRNFIGRNTDYEELTYKEWLSLYMNNKKFIPENIITTPLYYPRGGYLNKNKKTVILTRTACLGKFTMQNLNTDNYRIIDCNKQRVDYALKTSENPLQIPDYDNLKQYAANVDYILEQLWKTQKQNIFSYSNIGALVIDSFSEYVDTLFRNKKDGTLLCACYSDINRDTDFFDKYEDLGRLDLNMMYENYVSFFDKIIETYGEIPIVYLNFSAKYDDRPEFIERNKIITDTARLLEKKYTNFVSFELDFIEPNENDKSPYHYSTKTYKYLAKKVFDTCIIRGK